MKRSSLAWAAALFCILPANAALAAGMAHSDNFIILADDKALAEEVLANAEKFRREIAIQWLGMELPPSLGRSVVTIEIDDTQDKGLTWAVDRSGSSNRKYHKLWITAGREQAVGAVLKHEIAHAVFATQFPSRLPPFLDEGIASAYDDESRLATRAKLIQWYASTGNWPRLRVLFTSSQILASDKASYSAASSVVEYLLNQADRKTLLRFGQQGEAAGWDAALQSNYNISSVDQLQTKWQDWVRRQSQPSVAARAGSFK